MAASRQGIFDIAELCARRQVSRAVISPGSRSAPLTLAFLRHPAIRCQTIVDERSAAFIALGMAQQTGRPVALICTSGTAGLNYSPAIAEAYYQRIPLLVFTADRPPEWLDQNDGQTIHQLGMYGKLARASFELPVDATHPDAEWHTERVISEAINRCLWPVHGPVHVNVPLREPLYPTDEIEYRRNLKVITNTPSRSGLTDEAWDELLADWSRARKKLIVAGLLNHSANLAQHIARLRKHRDAAFFLDITSNLHDGQELRHSDMILGTGVEKSSRQLSPDLVISFGGPVVSKNLKLFLRKNKPAAHWHIDPAGQAIDTFQALTQVIPVDAEYFFSTLRRKSPEAPGTSGQEHDHELSYANVWRKLEANADRSVKRFLSDLPHCEFSAMARILSSLPAESNLHLGNSFIVRMASLLGLHKLDGVKVYSNRGTSGIDGTLSTALGAALVTQPAMTTLILGDLAFFYDRNGLWHDHVPSNLRIIIINNFGGGIFRILDGPNTLPELAKHFEVEHSLTAENTATDHNLNYFSCDSIASLDHQLSTFFQPSDRAGILEVQTDKHVNAETFKKFKSIMRELQ